MSHQVLSAASLSLIKKRARILSRTVGNKSYMQYLDQVAREQFGVRHYHEAHTRAKRKQAAGVRTGQAISVTALYMSNYMNSYMNNCQQYYLDI